MATRPLNDLTEWDKNPRDFDQTGLDRLKKQIYKYGVYKPSLVMPDGITLGGNMRLRTYRFIASSSLLDIKQEYKKLFNVDITMEQAQHIKESFNDVWVSEVSFIQKDDKYYAVVNGKEQFAPYDSLDDGMMEYSLSDNDHIAAYNAEMLTPLLEKLNIDRSLLAISVTPPTLLTDLLNTEPEDKNEAKDKLTDEFLIPPFSIFDTRQGYWQDRKRHWKGIGLDSGEGREEGLTYMNAEQGGEFADRVRAVGATTSVFDPVLTEVCYRWFVPEGGSILDPFAGGSVRGIVAGYLNIPYYGIDLREEQVEANRQQAIEVLNDNIDDDGLDIPKHVMPIWLTGDSLNIPHILDDGLQMDLIFSCPPYGDLEEYSEDPSDLSNMEHKDFILAYRHIIKNSVDRLKDNRFAVFTVGDFRDKKGFYRNFVSDTISAFEDAGAKLYNEIILVNTAGSLPLRAGRQFRISRKVGKMHQNVLVFYKGDPKLIKENFSSNVPIQEEELADQAGE